MKLLTKTSLYYLIFTGFIFAALGIVFYIQLKDIIDEDFTENLYLEKDVINKFVLDSGKLPEQQLYLGDNVTFLRTGHPVDGYLKDTLLINPLEDEEQLFRQLVFPLKIKDQNYTATISKPMFESEDLVENIVYPFTISAFIAMVILFVYTWVLQKQMWKPFYGTLKEFGQFDAKQNTPLRFATAKTLEFRMLNDEIEKMTEKMASDYRNLKEFTENASHEMQTPLAIIRSKMELMIQSENLTAGQAETIMEMFTSITRLSKLNESLLLLAKIENRQFPGNESVKSEDIINRKLGYYEDMINFRKLSVEKIHNASPQIIMNAYLADILFSNLIHNAIKHNLNDGKIIIEFNSDSVVISNTGNRPSGDPEDMFRRFRKESASNDSAGLGLAISKKICEATGFGITYKYNENLHKITVFFK